MLDVPGNVTMIDARADRAERRARRAGAPAPRGGHLRHEHHDEPRGLHRRVARLQQRRRQRLVDARADRRTARERAREQLDVDWAFVPLDNVESIEIVRGPASALYGDNAVAGVIHIRTRARRARVRRRSLHGRTGSYDTDGGSAWVGGGAGPGDAPPAFFDGYQTDGYRDHSALDGARGEMDVAVDLFGRGTLGVRGGYDSTGAPAPRRAHRGGDRRRPAPGRARERSTNFRPRASASVSSTSTSTLTEELTLHFDGHHRRRDDRDVDGRSRFFSFDERRRDRRERRSTPTSSSTPSSSGTGSRTLLGADWLQEDRDFDSVFERSSRSTFQSLRRTTRARAGGSSGSSSRRS